MKKLIFAFVLLSSVAKADPIYLPNIPGYATGTQIGSKNGLDVNIAGGTITSTNPSVSPTASAVPADATYIGANKSGNLTGLSLDSSGNLEVDLQTSLPAGSNGIGTVGVTSLPSIPAGSNTIGSINNISGTVSLPTGAATSALQTTGNSTLSTISGQLPASLGAQATSASLSIVPATSSVFATKSPVNANASLAATQSVSTTESYLSAPSNTVGAIVESESGNSANIRWGFSNSSTSILSSTTGMLMEPGRDTGFIPVGAGTYLHLISTSGTQSVDVQWVLSQ